MHISPNIMLTVDRAIAAPPEAAWRVLVDVGGWPKWGPAMTGARLDAPDDGFHQGSTGSVQGPFGVAAHFVVTEFDDGRYWVWTVANVPATRHGVIPIPGGGSRVYFAVPWWSAPYLAVCAVALRRIERLAVK